MKNKKVIKQIKPVILFLGISFFGIVIFLFFLSCLWIGSEVKSRCQAVKLEYKVDPLVGGQDCVENLTVLLNDENKSYRERNSAIWALGQLGDRRALSVLQTYYTGNIPNRESLDKTISQYELKKAINLTSGGFNAMAIFWRYGLINN